MTKFFAQKSPNGLSLLSKETGEVLQELELVPAEASHRSFVLSTWVKSYESHARKLSMGGLKLTPSEYRSGESSLAEAVFEHAKVLVSPEDFFTIHAWVCAMPGALWHVYVPPQLRGIGVAKAMVESVAGLRYVTHKPWPSTPRTHTVTWSPYIAGFGKPS